MSSLLISALPRSTLIKLGPLALIVVGYAVEKHFISRPALFSNTIALNTYMALSTKNFHIALEWYANIGLVLGIIAILFYISNTSLPLVFYKVSIIYMSIIVGIVIFIT